VAANILARVENIYEMDLPYPRLSSMDTTVEEVSGQGFDFGSVAHETSE